MLGRVSALAASVLSVPIYLYFLGVENFGIVGLYISIQAFFGLMDFGLPITANRQISVLRGKECSSLDIARLVRAFEIIILGVAALGAGISAAASPWISANWLNPVSLSSVEITIALIMAGGSAALRFPCAFYSNVLFAFDKHFEPNLITAIAAYLRVILAIAFLVQYGATLEIFFTSQLIVNGLELLALQFLSWRKAKIPILTLPDWQQFKGSVRLTLMLSLISITALGLSQIDKVILTKLLPLTEFGIYSVAYALAMGILPLAYSIGNAVFPELSRLKAKEISQESTERLSKALRLTLLLVLPAATFLITQSNGYVGVLSLFTPDANAVATSLPILALGSLFQAFVVLPHAYWIASAEPRYILWINAALALPYAVAVYFGTLYWGIVGVCWAFMILNFLGFAFHFHFLRLNKMWAKNYMVILLSISATLIISYGFSYFNISVKSLWWNFTVAIMNSMAVFAGLYYYLFYSKTLNK